MGLKTWLDSLVGQSKGVKKPVTIEGLVHLNRLKRDHKLVSVVIDDVDGEYQSMLLSIDVASGKVVMDQLHPKKDNEAELLGRKINVSVSGEGIPTRFQSEIIDIQQHRGHQELILALPSQVEAIQRRSSYRVPLKETREVQASVSLQQHQHNVFAKALNLSVDGIRLEVPGDHNDMLDATTSMFLRVGDEPLMRLKVRIRNMEIRGDDDSIKTCLGAEFVTVDPAQKKILEKFILQLQQEMRQRELENMTR